MNNKTPLYTIVDDLVRTHHLDIDTSIIVEETKTLAKKMFFNRELEILIDFIYDSSFEHTILENFKTISSIPEEKQAIFLFDFREKIYNLTNHEKTNSSKINTFLEVLDYGHLKSFITLFY